MKKLMLVAALATVFSSSGCCLGKRASQPVASATYCAPAPVACTPVMSCDPCQGQGVTYGMPQTSYYPSMQ